MKLKTIFISLSVLFCALSFNAQEAAREPLSKRLPVHWRAYSLNTDSAIWSIITEEDKVDILASVKVRETKTGERKVTLAILQAVTVLEKRADGENHALVLRVDPRDAAYLFLAEQQGTLKVILRNPRNTQLHSLPVTSLGDIFK